MNGGRRMEEDEGNGEYESLQLSHHPAKVWHQNIGGEKKHKGRNMGQTTP